MATFLWSHLGSPLATSQTAWLIRCQRVMGKSKTRVPPHAKTDPCQNSHQPPAHFPCKFHTATTSTYRKGERPLCGVSCQGASKPLLCCATEQSRSPVAPKQLTKMMPAWSSLSQTHTLRCLKRQS